MRMSHLKVGSAADIPLDIGELDLSQLTASLTTPSGREEPCLLKMLRNGHVGECASGVSKEKAEKIFSYHFNPCFNLPLLFFCMCLSQASRLFLRRLESTW